MMRAELQSSDNESFNEAIVRETREAAADLRNAIEEDDDEDLRNAYLEDAKDVDKVADLTNREKFREAFKLYYSLDTFVREAFPDSVIEYLFMKGHDPYQ